MDCGGIPGASLQYVVNHVLLPPKLPQEDDCNEQHEEFLLNCVYNAIQKFEALPGNHSRSLSQAFLDTARAVKLVNTGPQIVGESLLSQEILGLAVAGGDLPIHVKAQNAGIVIRRLDDGFLVALFELSPCNEAVMSTKGRLRRLFPGSAFHIQKATFDDNDFLPNFSRMVVKMSNERCPGMQPTVRKARQQHSEERDTTNPALVTEYFASFLRAVGESVQAPSIWKNTREEVYWQKCKNPWRRSSAWLLLRVSLQFLALKPNISNEQQPCLFKSFMVFFLANTLNMCCQHEMPTEVLCLIMAKISRRLLKLSESQTDYFWTSPVHEIVLKSRRLVEKRWKRTIAQSPPNLHLVELDDLKLGEDVVHYLPELDRFIAELDTGSSAPNTGEFSPAFVLDKLEPTYLPTIRQGPQEYEIFILARFEAWVEFDLTTWLELHLREVSTCFQLSTLLQTYFDRASKAYACNPDGYSIMVLTVLEIWVACDKTACNLHPMLKDYDARIPVTALRSLILPFPRQMQRLLKIEQYLELRAQVTQFDMPLVFFNYASPLSFPVRYFDDSLQLQSLLSEIQQWSQLKRQEKCNELGSKRQEHSNLMAQYHRNRCECVYRRKRRRRCFRCGLRTEADNLHIEIFEDPLPTDLFERKAAVFEMRVPEPFRSWRDITVVVLDDVFGGTLVHLESPRAKYPLLTYSGLANFITPQSTSSRVILLSQEKPHMNTHRRTKKDIPNVTEGDICVHNGMKLRYYDSSREVFLANFGEFDKIHKPCTYQLPLQFAKLQHYLDRAPLLPSGLPPNTVMAKQNDCPKEMALEEYRALSSLGLGYRIQWMNLLRQIANPSFDLARDATSAFVHQLIYQAGPSNGENFLRASHELLRDKVFGETLVVRLKRLFEGMHQNWDMCHAVACLIHITSRLLSLSTTPQVRKDCLSFLEKARSAVFCWVDILTEKAQQSNTQDLKAQYLSKRLEAALICASTYDLEHIILGEIISITKHASLLLKISILMGSSYVIAQKGQSQFQATLIGRWQRILYRAYPLLATEIIMKKGRCLDPAVKSFWPSYEASGIWVTSHEHWLTSTTCATSSLKSMRVQFNLLTGELLVNGLPLSNLPSEYAKHPSCALLFGNSALAVMPSNVPGFEFSTKELHAGWTIHMGARVSQSQLHSSNSSVAIRAIKGQRVCDLIPADIFNGKLPSTFEKEFVHWYDHARRIVEFRPIKSPWLSCESHWLLLRRPLSWSMEKEEHLLFGMPSMTAKRLSYILKMIEDPSHILVYSRAGSASISIELPRLKLEFTWIKGSTLIHSRQYPGMCVDALQDASTLVGLRNKLLLRPENDAGERLLLIPEGRIEYTMSSNHVLVDVNKNSACKIHSYSIDTTLGYLRDNGNLQSRLYLCYLHALTSHCLPDPLTQRTGTEQALSILNSATTKSFPYLTEANFKILNHIQRLTPTRDYYPANLTIMQTVDWDSCLPSLSQHGRFHILVQDIYRQSSGTSFMYPEAPENTYRAWKVNDFLLQRDLIRSASFRVSNFGAENFCTLHDFEYKSRDRNQSGERAQLAYAAALSVLRPETPIFKTLPGRASSSLWDLFCEGGSVRGPLAESLQVEVEFDYYWLADVSTLIANTWFLVQTFLKNTQRDKRFKISAWLSLLAFAPSARTDVIQIFASFYRLQNVSGVAPPSYIDFNPPQGYEIKRTELIECTQAQTKAFESCPEAHLPQLMDETEYDADARRMRQFRNAQDEATHRLVDSLASQWPCQTPRPPIHTSLTTYLNMPSVLPALNGKFEVWFRNRCLKDYLEQLVQRLQSLHTLPIQNSSWVLLPTVHVYRQKVVLLDTVGMLSVSAPALPNLKIAYPDLLACSTFQQSTTSDRTVHFVQTLKTQAKSNYEKKYCENLHESLTALNDTSSLTSLKVDLTEAGSILRTYLCGCEAHLEEIYSALCQSLKGDTLSARALAIVIGHTPRVSPIFFLEQLNHKNLEGLEEHWKTCLIQYGVAITRLQQARRLVARGMSEADLVNELTNKGHENWDPYEFPETLLFEIENGILIRARQEEIAKQMREPPSNLNACMQLNMGEGKSTVIVPIVVAALADGNTLTRVIVTKPQSKQMLQLLVVRLGGMLARRVYHLPYSRALRLNLTQSAAIRKMCEECMSEGGILLVQPENILSFKLIGLERLIEDNLSIATSYLETQIFFDEKSRDVIDESDENFSVKFELIYTVGTQRAIDGSPDRWIMMQKLLKLLVETALELESSTLNCIEIEQSSTKGYPVIKIVDPCINKPIIERLAQKACNTTFPGLPIAFQTGPVKRAILNYITMATPNVEAITILKGDGSSGFWTDVTKGPLLLLRGLLAGGVIIFALTSKKWRVNFGPDPKRVPKSRLAVPYRAKDVPSLRSEFSHPDVAIFLTLLSYYYSGLDDDDLFSAFDLLIKSDQGQSEYEEWTKEAPDLPLSFLKLTGVNLRDRTQCIESIFPHLRYSKCTIDYFVSNLIFAKEMKEFPYKLSASGWDIGQTKTHATTGFSGTNDAQQLLPLTVHQLDLQSQRHTNALVIGYLLQQGNSVLQLPGRLAHHDTIAETILATINSEEPRVRVILDVGAQILELDNLAFAKLWLESNSDADGTRAVVFFNDNDELSVIDRAQYVESLQTSPFAKHLDLCLVFLDEAHTRGTDLKLPVSSRAAVTLGEHIPKDKLVQACMRMRKLGKGQTVVFCVPKDFRTKIIALRPKQIETDLQLEDILRWALYETFSDMRRSMSLWAIQGARFQKQQLFWEATQAGRSKSQTWAQRFLEEEAQTLEQRYSPQTKSKLSEIRELAAKNPDIARILERCSEFDDLDEDSANLEEEQERELAPEIEQERQQEMPAPAEANPHSLAGDVKTFAMTGVFKRSSLAFMPAFQSLCETSAARYFDVKDFKGNVWVTADFANTVQVSDSSYVSDSYEQPVQWILTSCAYNGASVNNLVIISPYEAQELFSTIRNTKKVTLHIYSPRVNLCYEPLSNLDLFTLGAPYSPAQLPRQLRLQLDLFAGQLYLSSFDDYVVLCDYLNLAHEPASDDIKVAPDGFIDSNLGSGIAWKKSPVKFLKTFLTKIRRNCDSIDKTHMGRILNGELLTKADFPG